MELVVKVDSSKRKISARILDLDDRRMDKEFPPCDNPLLAQDWVLECVGQAIAINAETNFDYPEPPRETKKWRRARLLQNLADTQEAFWNAAREFEEETGIDLNDLSQDFAGLDIADIRKMNK